MAPSAVLNGIALGAMYWTLVLSVTAVLLLAQSLVSIVFIYGERDDH